MPPIYCFLGFLGFLGFHVLSFSLFPIPSYGGASFAGEFLCLLAANEMSLGSQSPVNPPAAIFRRHGGLPEGGSSWRPTVGGDKVSRGPPAYGLVRSELPHRTVVLRAAKCGSRAVGLGFSHRRLGWVL